MPTSSILIAFSLRDRFAAMSWLEMVLWFGLAFLTAALLVLMLTRWGQVRPVSKCVALSVFAHLLFFTYAYGTKLSFSGGWSAEPTVQVSFVDPAEFDESEWVETPQDADIADLPPDLTATPPEVVETESVEPAESTRTESIAAPPIEPEAIASTASPPALLPLPEPAPEPDTSAPPIVIETPPEEIFPTPEQIAETPAPLPAADPAPPADPTPPTPDEDVAAEENIPNPSTEEIAATEPAESKPSDDSPLRLPEPPRESLQTAAAAPPSVPRRRVDERPVPAPYRMRMAENRLQLALPFGATDESEAAVQAALLWLASVQSPDGRWDASDFGAGRETKTLGHDRQSAGEDADTGITGLALLAMLGAGNTHLDGDYRETVQHALEYLLRSQGSDGSLAGPAKLFERMYCHGIAALALGEAYALTGDPRLQPALQRAVAFTSASQHPTSGGWRYQPGDRGDVSQFGWQVMALRSASLGGLHVEPSTRSLMLKFLQSATSGPQQGLAGYRPGERPTRTMTAEALACRFFLDTPPSSAAAQEATAFVMQELPGQGQPNLYYWYYATLALYHDQGPAWPTWNKALQACLISRQRRDGRLAGSWDTDDVWGGYGGRIYTTAMGALCLEVYYRYLPVYELETTRQAGAVRGPDRWRR